MSPPRSLFETLGLRVSGRVSDICRDLPSTPAARGDRGSAQRVPGCRWVAWRGGYGVIAMCEDAHIHRMADAPVAA